MTTTPERIDQRIDRTALFFEHFIYGGRWVIAPMYVGLLISLVLYTYKFLAQLWIMCRDINHTADAQLVLAALGLIDATMVGNLIYTIMVGSYSIFIRKMQMNEKDRPQWLDKINASTLKIKMGMSLIGISSIHLLRDFLDALEVPQEVFIRHISIHGVFLLSTFALAITDKIAHSTEVLSHSHEKAPPAH